MACDTLTSHTGGHLLLDQPAEAQAPPQAGAQSGECFTRLCVDMHVWLSSMGRFSQVMIACGQVTHCYLYSAAACTPTDQHPRHKRADRDSAHGHRATCFQPACARTHSKK